MARTGTESTQKFLLRRLLTHKKLFIASVLLAAVNGPLVAFMGRATKPLMDGGLLKSDWSAVKESSMWLFLAMAGSIVASFAFRYLLRIATERTMRDLRRDIFARYLVLSPAQAGEHTSGQATTHVVNDVFVVSQGLYVVIDVIRSPITILAILISLFSLSWQLTLVCALGIPLIGQLGKALGKSARRNQGRIQSALQGVTDHTIESMRALRTVQAYGENKRVAEEFQSQLALSYRYLIRLAKTEELSGPLNKIVTSLFACALFAFGGWLVVQGHMTVGGLTAFIVSAGQLLQPLRDLNNIQVRSQTVLAGAERIQALLAQELDPISQAQQGLLTRESPRKIPVTAPVLAFDNVSFSYPNRGHAVRGISLRLEAGEKLALVGKSGSGKSTLSLLALRLLDPSAGRVTLGGRDARDWDLLDYRSHFSYVSQDVFLFNRSVRENMLFAKSVAGDKEIWDALEKSQVRQLVESMPDGLNTVLGEHATRMSGGEKQRLAIARAFLRDAPLLVLDEATSHLDVHNEKAVQSALSDLVKNRSVLVIAHRLNTIRDAHRVAVLDEGQLVEEGRFEDLMGAQGVFQKLWQAHQHNA